MPKKEQDYSLIPADGKNWGKGDYPPRGDHLCEVISVEAHMNYEETDVVWDIELNAVDVGGSLTDKAGRDKASSACLAAGFGEEDPVQPDDLVGETIVVRFNDAPGVGKGKDKLYRSVQSYFHVDDMDVTNEGDIDFGPPPQMEKGERAKREPRKRGSASDNGKEDEIEEKSSKRTRKPAPRKRSKAPS